MDNIYFRGIREILSEGYESEIDQSRFICVGVYYGDQHIINALFREKIIFLPPKFGIWFMIGKYIKKYKSLKPIIYTTNELRKANNKPIIRHLWGTTQKGLSLTDKPWLFNQTCKIKKGWQYYAKKTGYYFSKCKFFKNAC